MYFLGLLLEFLKKLCKDLHAKLWGFWNSNSIDLYLHRRMLQNGKSMPNLDQQSTKLLNLTVLQRIDPFIEEIIITASHVTFYKFNSELSQWFGPSSLSLSLSLSLTHLLSPIGFGSSAKSQGCRRIPFHRSEVRL
ncbi:hypothetical protein HS088_TW02G00275 [Tripterygium wilfordii]|uniref:Uncharacterized protein n=1 Tax=Tripterygium wilfordii TaxID=458696 RepID=A0A7J7DY74_TRIWF|nr:hypothetical protein HS088_TW02G00275 [Tripterygium wilfordii]